jgi:hypothetical protein
MNPRNIENRMVSSETRICAPIAIETTSAARVCGRPRSAPRARSSPVRLALIVRR